MGFTAPLLEAVESDSLGQISSSPYKAKHPRRFVRAEMLSKAADFAFDGVATNPRPFVAYDMNCTV